MSTTMSIFDTHGAEILLDYQIVTEDELALVEMILGANRETYEAILFAKTGYRTFEQFEDATTE